MKKRLAIRNFAILLGLLIVAVGCKQLTRKAQQQTPSKLLIGQPPPPPPPPLDVAYRIAPTKDQVMRTYFWPIVTNWWATNTFGLPDPRFWTTNFYSQTNNKGAFWNLERIAEISWIGEAGRVYVVETSVTGGGTPHPPGTVNQGWIGDGWVPCSLFITGYSGTMNFTSAIPAGPRLFRLQSL